MKKQFEHVLNIFQVAKKRVLITGGSTGIGLVCSKEAFMRMKKQRQGHIILIGSMSEETKDEDSSLYVATKVAIQGFAESFRKEVNDYDIHVTLIEPGAVDAPMQTMSQTKKDKQVKDLEMLRSEDIAQAILYVLSQNERCSVVDLKIRPLKQLI